ncbi:MAG: deoxyribose-phosphate aldolase [Lachnospiraceae bacterium]|nr:deoxyribose-phosphate aldolase [Lachnospiraceae bacterium]
MKFSKYFDHTILKADATAEDVKKICEEAKEYDFASVCVNSYYTPLVAEELKDTDVKVCSVIGFPLGAMSTLSKKLETVDAIENGADEIDMVINVGALKAKDYDEVLYDIQEVKDGCVHNPAWKEAKLKVIIETCLLTEEEKIKACELATEAGADFVKTSTGFSTGGATASDVALMKKMVAGKAWVKASGGIRDLETAKAMIQAGADRLGTSATVAIMKEYENEQ